MPPATSLPSAMADLLGRGGTILTGNQRAARTLRIAFDRHASAAGLAVWEPPAIFAWETWTAALYRQLLLDGHASRVLLNRSQELRLWESILSADPEWASFETPASLAELASSAWGLLGAYRGQSRLRSLGVSADTRSFQRWAQAFHRRCQTEALLSAPEMEEPLAAAIASGKLLPGATEILLVGFDRQTPAQQLLTAAVRDFGVTITEDLPSSHSEGGDILHLAAAEDPAAELRLAALWLRSFLLENPAARVAVIVPDISAERREIDRVFRQVLAPELEDIAAASAGPWEFSLGQPLASVPIVATALEVLRLAAGPLPIPEVSLLLLSPYFTIAPPESSDHCARAEFDAFDLRRSRSLRPEIALDRLIALAGGSRRAASLAPLLRQLHPLKRTAEKVLAAPGRKSFSARSEDMRELLESASWAVSGRLDSAEFQARRKWESALDELASLDLLPVSPSSRAAYTDALASLEGILQRTLFAPESRDAPIQIMSPLEAAGSRFDALWFLRASDLDWPVPAATHPLLGWRLQRELAMPGSDPSLDAAHARRITGRIAGSAPTVVFSYARQTADGRQRSSPLLAGFHLEPFPIPEDPAAPPAAALEFKEEEAFVRLANLRVGGGAEVLKLQAACAFRAFAERRLHSTALEDAQPGMDAREAGRILHKALEHLWTELRTHSALAALTPAQRRAQLSRSIDASLGAHAKLASDSAAAPWDDAYLDLQRRRLHTLLGSWLNEHELERAPFEVVLHEEKQTVSIGPLTFEVRIDRADRILDAAGGEVLIDYKAGNPHPSDWTTDRPDEPQLPLYAILRSAASAPGEASEKAPIAAVAFARIRAGKEMALHGYSSRENLLGKSKPAKMSFETLDEQIEDWRRVLTALAQDFADGDTRVLPKDYPDTCKFCGQRLLCRLDPSTLLIDPDKESVEEDYA